MSDPLSVTAGIAGFISLGIQVTQTLVDFYSDYKNQDKDVAKVTSNMENLQNMFRNLETAVLQSQPQPDAKQLLQEVDKATQKCQEIIEELQSESQKFEVTPHTSLKARIQAAGRRATYPFRKSTLQKIEEDVGEIRENLLFSLNVLQFKSHNRIEDDIAAVRSLLEQTYASQASLAMRLWLQAPDISVNHIANYSKHHPQTGEWFLNSPKFANWLVERNSFLWINGFAGCGKSVLCSSIIRRTFRDTLGETKSKIKVGVAFFYFDFNDESKQDANGMLRALLLQLSTQFLGGERELEQLRMLSEPYRPSQDMLIQTLQSFFTRFHDIYIILDALDECPRDRSREDVLKVIEVVRSWDLPSLHLLVTARDHLDIRRSLDPSHGCDVSMKNSGIDKDIFDFVAHHLEHDRMLQKWKVRHGEIQEKLTQGAQGVFRYVECQLNSLRRARNRNQIDKCLNTLPRDLNDTYERLFCEIEELYIEDVRRILAVLCFSPRPLTIDELIDAHSVELEDGESPHLDREGRAYEPDDLVDICLGLVEIVETVNEDGKITLTVRIAHFSIQEYLQSERIYQQKAKTFAIARTSASAELAQICLAYLLNPELSDGSLNDAKLREFPLAHFAAVHWYHFYQGSQEDGMKTEKLLLRMFQNESGSFVTWVRLHRIDMSWDMKVLFDKEVDDEALPVYYASLLGLKITLRDLMETYQEPPGLSRLIASSQFGVPFGNALQAASYNGHTEVVRILLDEGADVNARCGQHGDALQAASVQGHLQVVQMLLDQGSDPNLQTELLDANPLQAAAYAGHTQVAQILLDYGADVNAEGGRYGNALQAAALAGHIQVVQILLSEGAEVNAEGGEFENALHAASIDGWGEMVQLLLDRGADVNAQGGYHGNALQAAASEGYGQVAQILLDGGAEVNAEGGHYGNALQAAASRGHGQVVQILLDQGADLNAEGGHYGSALQAASSGGHSQVVKMLLDRDPDTQDELCVNALQTAAWKGHSQVVKTLLDRGIDPDIEGDVFEGNALQAASWKGHSEVVKTLLDNGANVNSHIGDHGSALQIASWKGHSQVVQMLLESGADLDAEDGIHGTAFRAASNEGHTKVVQMLLSRVSQLKGSSEIVASIVETDI